MPPAYVQKQHDVYRITGTRVSLDSIVYAWRAGQSAETIAQSFPVLTLEQVYGTLAFYLAQREEMDRYLEHQRADYEAKRQAARDAEPMFYQKMAEARRRLFSARAFSTMSRSGNRSRPWAERCTASWSRACKKVTV